MKNVSDDEMEEASEILLYSEAFSIKININSSNTDEIDARWSQVNNGNKSINWISCYFAAIDQGLTRINPNYEI